MSGGAKDDPAVIKDNKSETYGSFGKDNALPNQISGDSWEGSYLYFVVIGGLPVLGIILGVYIWGLRAKEINKIEK